MGLLEIIKEWLAWCTCGRERFRDKGKCRNDKEKCWGDKVLKLEWMRLRICGSFIHWMLSHADSAYYSNG